MAVQATATNGKDATPKRIGLREKILEAAARNRANATSNYERQRAYNATDEATLGHLVEAQRWL